MNTKTLISAFILLLLFSFNNPANAFQSQPKSSGTTLDGKIPSHGNTEHEYPFSSNDLFYNVPKMAAETGHDHETHHLHYDRFSKNRSRFLVIFIKAILFAAHVGIFLLTTIHLPH